MKQINKFKYFNKVRGKYRVSNRLLKFKRPKWKSVKRFFLKNVKKHYYRKNYHKKHYFKKRPKRRKIRRRITRRLPEVYKQNVRFGWDKLKKSFSNKINRARFLLLINNHDRRKKAKVQAQTFTSKADKINGIYLKRFFELDFFLYSVCLSSSVEESKKYMQSKKVFKNKTNFNVSNNLVEGDLLSIDSNSYKYLKIKNKFHMSETFCSFYEYDYYTQSFFILKDFSEVNKKDIHFTSPVFI